MSVFVRRLSNGEKVETVTVSMTRRNTNMLAATYMTVENGEIVQKFTEQEFASQEPFTLEVLRNSFINVYFYEGGDVRQVTVDNGTATSITSEVRDNFRLQFPSIYLIT